jgi:ATP phosphoribosyltransferase
MPVMIKIALPAGDSRAPVAGLLDSAGLPIEGYGEGSRSYRLEAHDNGALTARVFREKDIPVQVALGNYDLGVCSLAWVKEMQARFPNQPIVPLMDLGIGKSSVFAASAEADCQRLEDLGTLPIVRIASEFPNLAELFARSARLRRYRVQAVWGAAEAYPPEDADCVVTAVSGPSILASHGLRPLHELLDNSAWLIGNAKALAAKDLSPIVGQFSISPRRGTPANRLRLPPPIQATVAEPTSTAERETLRLAVPDGHQHRHVVEALRAAGLTFDGYGDGETVRRPTSGISGLDVKVIRPHDMPSLVATGEIDLAITGRDCLLEHRYAFPSSPATELLDLQRGQYNLSAVVSEDLPASTIDEALQLWRAEGKPLLRVAAEFPATADNYARSRHFWRYQIIPIAGASEGFVPEDADLLIEGTETGKTIAENRLKVIDLLYRSTTCVIGHRGADLVGIRRRVFDQIMEAFQTSARGGSLT